MKKAFLASLVAFSTLLFSCKKEQISPESGTLSNEAISGRVGPDPDPNGCEPFPYGILALNGGTITINSSRNLIGDVGYSRQVTSNINQKIDNFTGTAYVHSQVNSFIYTAATYQPTGGIIRNDAVTDIELNQANDNAVALSANYAGLAPNFTYGAVTGSLSITAVSMNTVVQMSSMDYNSKTLTLNGTAGGDDGFIINVQGNFDFSQSVIVLNNVRPERVIFNFPNASAITINKAANVFKGTILAPIGNVIYHNPASFEGSIIARNIALHSDFNLTQRTYCTGNTGS